MNGKGYTNEQESVRIRFLMTVICVIAVIMVIVYFTGSLLEGETAPEAPDGPESGTGAQSVPENTEADVTDGTEPAPETEFKVHISFSGPSGAPPTDVTEPADTDDQNGGTGTDPAPEETDSTDKALPEIPEFPYDMPIMTPHVHHWTLPTCTQRALCMICGIGGEGPIAHDYMDATCTVPKTCKICGATEGDPAGHDWMAATCLRPETCSICGEERGEIGDHSWIDATCVTPVTCIVCGETSGEALGHWWIEATCSQPQTCGRCGATQGEPNGHSWLPATTTSPATCAACGAVYGDRLPNPVKVAPISYTEAELHMLARLIYREIGYTSDAGMRAVATVVVNRIRSPYFGTNVTEVLNAPGQFPGSLDGINAPEICYTIAKDVLAGNLYDSEILYFKAAYTGIDWGPYRHYCFCVAGANFYI